MSDYVALQWTDARMIGLEAELADDEFVVERSFVVPMRDDVEFSQDPVGDGQWLATQLQQHEVRSHQVLISLPRELVTVRRLDVPAAADELLPGIVRYQAGMHSSLPLDQLILDFVPMHQDAETTGRSVLLATVDQQLIHRLTETMATAGLEVTAIGISSFAMLEVVARIEKQRGWDSNDTSFVVLRDGQTVEIALMRQRDCLFCRDIHLAGDDPQQNNRLLLGEISRALVALEPLLGESLLKRVWLIGDASNHAEVEPQLAQRLDVPVHLISDGGELPAWFDRRDADIEFASLAGPIGMVLSCGDRLVRETIDFARPRRPVVRPSRMKRLLAPFAVALLVFVALSWAGFRYYLGVLDQRIANKRIEEEKLDAQLQQGQPVLESVGAIRKWRKRNVNWLRQMQVVNDAMPDTERAYLESWMFQSASAQRPPRLQALGRAREQDDVQKLNQQVAEQPGFQLQPKGIQDGPSFEAYPIRFDLDVDLTLER